MGDFSGSRARNASHIEMCINRRRTVIAQSLVGDNVLWVIIYFVPIAHKHIIVYIIIVLERFVRNACSLFYIIYILYLCTITSEERAI